MIFMFSACVWTFAVNSFSVGWLDMSVPHVSSILNQLPSARLVASRVKGYPSERRELFLCSTINKHVVSSFSTSKISSGDSLLRSKWDQVTVFFPLFCSHVRQIVVGPLCRTWQRSSWKPSYVKSDDSEVRSTEDILDEQSLQRDLQLAIKEEDYARAAKIRDNLRLLYEDSKTSVLAANACFYNAFRNGDLAAMQTLWSKGENVYCVHPGAGGISGYDLVRQSWEVVCGADYDFPIDIELKNVQVHVRGNVGYVTCEEFVKTKGNSWGKQVATNVFERIDGQWFVCIHHASYVDM